VAFTFVVIYDRILGISNLKTTLKQHWDVTDGNSVLVRLHSIADNGKSLPIPPELAAFSGVNKEEHPCVVTLYKQQHDSAGVKPTYILLNDEPTLCKDMNSFIDKVHG